MTKHSKTNQPKAYSYVRFSTPEQSKGDSLRRQIKASEQYATLHGLDLDDKLTFRDIGVSGYRGANEEIGQLGDFLAAVEHKDVKPGSYLLVESLDRLSRQKPRKAVKVLERICEAGITVVTLDDGRAYTEAVLDDDPMALMVAILVASRAHEESLKKGRRVGAAWAEKRRRAAEKPLTSISPGWVRLKDDRTGFDLIDERAAIVRRIFEEALAGRGQHEIAKALNREGVPVFGRGKVWYRSYVAKMLQDASTIGTYTPHKIEIVDGVKRRVPTGPVEGYFPAAIDQETFERVAHMGSARAKVSTTGVLQNILGNLARCPQCDSTMTRVNKGSSPKGGRPYLVCVKAKVGDRCDYRQVRLDYVEQSVLDRVGELCAAMPSPEAELQTELDRATAQEAAVADEIERLVIAIGRVGHSEALADRLRTLEGDRDSLRDAIRDLEDRVADTLSNRLQDTLARLQDVAEARDIAAVNATLRQLFTAVTVDYRTGALGWRWRHADETTWLTYAWVDMGAVASSK